jgi:hypothetical protein
MLAQRRSITILQIDNFAGDPLREGSRRNGGNGQQPAGPTANGQSPIVVFQSVFSEERHRY